MSLFIPKFEGIAPGFLIVVSVMVEKEMNNLNNDLKEEHCVRKLETRAKFHYHLTKTFSKSVIISSYKKEYIMQPLEGFPMTFLPQHEQLH